MKTRPPPAIRQIFWAVFLASTVTAFRAGAAEEMEISVAAGTHDRAGSLVAFELPESARRWKNFALRDSVTGRSVDVQLEASPSPRLLWTLDTPLKAGEVRRYHLSESEKRRTDESAGIEVKKDDNLVSVRLDGKPVLAYHIARTPSADPKEPAFGRSGYIHPVYDPAGAVVTDDMPPDNYHQHGLMFAWVDTTFEGRHVDFWNSAKHEGEVRHVALVDSSSGPVFGSFTAKLDHVDLTAPGGEKTALHETWVVRIYRNSTHRNSGGYLFDLESTQTCATDSQLIVNKYHYGGMAARGARSWLGERQCDFLTSAGKTRADGNHTRAEWCDMSGELAGHVSGITLFCDPRNFRAPQPVRLHPDKPNFCWAPLALDSFTIEPGKPYVSRYRFYIHCGKPDRAALEQIWSDFTEPLIAKK